MKLLRALWVGLRDPDNRGALMLLGGGLTAVVAAAWAVFTFFYHASDKTDLLGSAKWAGRQTAEVAQRPLPPSQMPRPVVKWNPARDATRAEGRTTAEIQFDASVNAYQVTLTAEATAEARGAGQIVLSILTNDVQCAQVSRTRRETDQTLFVVEATCPVTIQAGRSYRIVAKSDVTIAIARRVSLIAAISR